jgi:hypothetical protein
MLYSWYTRVGAWARMVSFILDIKVVWVQKQYETSIFWDNIRRAT